MKQTLAVYILVIILSQGISYAQGEVQRKVFSPVLSSVVEYQSWKKDFGGESQSISQFSIPTMFKLPVTRNIAFDVMGSAISSSAEDDSLSGLCDVKARGVAMLADDTVMVSAGVNLPSGKSDLDSEEVMASALLSDRAIGFYNKLGEGFDISVGGGFAKTYEPATLGVGLGYLLKGKYTPSQDSDSEYQPGNQLNITGGFDLLLDSVLLRSDVTYTIYQPDKLGGSEVFREGTRFAIEETAVLGMESFSLLLSGRYVTRGEAELLYAGFDNETRQLYGAQLGIDGAVNLKIAERMTLELLSENTFIGKNDSDQNDATVFAFGVGLNMGFMRTSSIDVNAMYHTGSSNDGNVSLKGLSTTAAVRVIF